MTRTIRALIILAVLLLAILAGCVIATAAATVNAAAPCNVMANVRPLNSFVNVRATPAIQSAPPVVRTVTAGTVMPVTGIRFNETDKHNWYELCGGGWVRDDVIILATVTPTRITGPSSTPTATATATATATLASPIQLGVLYAEMHLHENLATDAAFASELHATDAAEIAHYLTEIATP